MAAVEDASTPEGEESFTAQGEIAGTPEGEEPVAAQGEDGLAATPVAQRCNRLHWFAGRVHEVLEEVTAGGVRVAELNAVETAEAVQELCRLISRIEGLKAVLLAHGDRIDVAKESAATSTAAWLAAATRTPRGRAHGLVRLARHLDATSPTAATATAGADGSFCSFAATEAALLAGRVDVDQAQVITDAVTALPGFVPAADRHRAETHLLAEATRHDAQALKRLARHLLEVIDPETAEAQLARRLEREETAAARRTFLHLADAGDGTTRGTFRIPTLQAAMLTVALDALASPQRPDPIARELPDEEGHLTPRPTPEILGQAFCELLDRYPTKKLPQAGGGLATVLVTIPLAVLEERLGVATLSTGGHLSAGAARRLACHHGLIPQVLGTRSEPLDQGRKTRLHTEPQRIAMISRDQTCTVTGCTIPAAWCHAHHTNPWGHHGHTSVKDGRMVCPRHHRMIHHPTYHTDYLPTGKIHLTRRRRQ